MQRSIGKTFSAAALAVLFVGPTRQALADDNHQALDRRAIDRVVRLDQAVHIMTMEFNGAPHEADASANRRVIDAEGLLALGRSDEASTILLSVIREWPHTRAAQDATFLLGNALFRLGDFLSARSFYEEAVAAFTGTRREQRAVSQLIEIALRTGDYQPVDRYLLLLARVPDAQLDPCVPYVRAKLGYQRGQLDRAVELFAAIPATSPFSWQAHYFIGTIKVKQHDLKAAAEVYETLLRTAAPDEQAREIQELARLAAARICLDQERLECAQTHYLAIPAKSKFLGVALYELGFAYVRSKRFDLAQQTFERLLGHDPEGAQSFDVRVLVGNLWLRRGDMTTAQRFFSATSSELTPAYDRLRAVEASSVGEASFPVGLAALGVDGVARDAFGTVAGRNWARADPEVARLLGLARDIADAPKELAQSKGTIQAIEVALAHPDSQALFPDLTRSRSALTHVSTELLAIRARFAEDARHSEAPYLAAAEATRLDGNRVQLAEITRELTARLTRGPSPDAARPSDERYAAPMLPSRSHRETGAPHDTVAWQPMQEARFEAGEPGATTSPMGDPERGAPTTPTQLRDLLQEEQQLHQAVRARMGAPERSELDRALAVLSRTDATLFQLVDLDTRIDDEIAVRLNKAKAFVSARRQEVAAAEKTADGVATEARNVDEPAMRSLRAHLSQRLASLVVLADVGLIDVSWARKSRVTSKIQVQQNSKNRELEVMRASMEREEAALTRHFAAVTEWARLAGVPVVDPDSH